MFSIAFCSLSSIGRLLTMCVIHLYQSAKWAGHICRHRGCLQLPRRHLWSEGGRHYTVWAVGWQWTYSRISHLFRSIEGCYSSQSNPIWASSHVSCEANILVWYLQGISFFLLVVHCQCLNFVPHSWVFVSAAEYW